jgi:hypothetical protein
MMCADFRGFENSTREEEHDFPSTINSESSWPSPYRDTFDRLRLTHAPTSLFLPSCSPAMRENTRAREGEHELASTIQLAKPIS